MQDSPFFVFKKWEYMDKAEKLREYLKNSGSAAIAFSGGVDSAYLLKTAHDTLGDKCIAVTVRADWFPQRETQCAKDFCIKYGIKQVFIDVKMSDIRGFAENPPNRCYLCKSVMFQKIKKAAFENGAEYVAEGSNTDDEGDYRPGLIAIKEQGIKSPLRAVGMNKAEIRAFSRQLGLDESEKPSFACLASRFVYGEQITAQRLEMVDRAERFLLDMGFTQVRVRLHGDRARIEILPEQFEKMLQNKIKAYEYIKSLGFAYVSLDLKGYRTGSMNETL